MTAYHGFAEWLAEDTESVVINALCHDTMAEAVAELVSLAAEDGVFVPRDVAEQALRKILVEYIDNAEGEYSDYTARRLLGMGAA